MASPINVSSVTTAPAQAGGSNRSVGNDPAGTRQVAAPGGNSAPVASTPRPAATTPSAQDVAQATRDISEYMQSVNRSLQISVDKSLGSTIITVLDSETDEVVRQIPQEEIVAVARFLEQQLAAEGASQSNPVRGLLVDSES
ncbi:MAG: flagellar protein FlaG [Chromatocurvus sp.]